uniref:Uncharacterized protein n=1 Tax=Ditylenchus dipsaci TaxID=166011 RepID=A0A915DCF7_9BILA
MQILSTAPPMPKKQLTKCYSNRLSSPKPSLYTIIVILIATPHLFRDQLPAFLVAGQDPATVGSAPPSAKPILRCYTCSSLQTGVPKTAIDSNQATGAGSPSTAQHDTVPDRNVCDDPFEKEDALLEPCDTSCIKTISKNAHTEIVLRGCLSSIYNRASSQHQVLQMPEMGSVM